MKIAIIVFSPSGNTSNIGHLLADELEKLGGVVSFYDISRSTEISDGNNYGKYLENNIGQHDVLCLGAPVYEHHYPEVMLRLIKALPAPSETWGRYVLPFATYGRICSGSALEKAAKVLNRSGRTVVSGLKISAPHTLLETILKRDIGVPGSKEEMLRLVSVAAKRIISLENVDTLPDQSKGLRYQGFIKRMIDNTILNPNMKFINLLPSICIDTSKCTKCQVCIKKCPTNHLGLGENGTLVEKNSSSCIHCFNCMKCCPQNAITQNKNIKIVEMFVKLLTKGGFENPPHGIYPDELIL